MKKSALFLFLSMFTAAAIPAFATVSVSSPISGSTVASPVAFRASASTACAKGVSAMGIYVDNTRVYVANGSSLSTSVTMSPGAHRTVVQEWDGCGGSTATTVNVTVSGGSTQSGVTVSSPVNGSTVTSPVSYVATASSPSCAYGVSAVGIYVDGTRVYVANGSSLNTAVTMSSGAHRTVVQEWDGCGGSQATTVNVTVGSGTTPTQNGVTVSSPANGSTVTSPVNYVATAGSTTCSAGISAMGIYVDNTRVYVVNASSLNTSVTMSPGSHRTVVQEWDRCGGSLATTVNVTVGSGTTVSMTASPLSITAGGSSTLSVTATDSTGVTVTGTDGSKYTLPSTGGTQVVTPAATTTYTATAAGATNSPTASVTVSVAAAGGGTGGADPIQHVVFMLQENHTFDNYFGMLNPYRQQNGWNVGDDGMTYNVDGIDDKLTSIVNYDDQGTGYNLFKLASTCVDDESSAFLESYGDVNRWDFSPTRGINMDGFVHTAEGFANNCNSSKSCSAMFTDVTGKRAMGYYDQGFLNYYYYMASQFAVSDRWFSPISSKSIDNRIATFTGGTTQGLVNDPGQDDHLPQLAIPTIFQELQNAGVSWKIYYTVTQGECIAGSPCSASPFPGTNFTPLTDSSHYLYENPSKAACSGTTQPSSVVGDSTNSFCIDPNHIAPLSQYYTDLTKGTLPSFAFIEAGYGNNDEHPGSGQEVLSGQTEVSKVINAFMNSPEWSSSVFFLSYDEGGGPYDHVPPVPGSSNKNTDASLGSIPDISTIAVNPDGYNPCLPTGGTPTLHCDLNSNDPGAKSTDAAAKYGFAAQLGFRVPNLVISPYTRKHYVSHIPMDHTAIIKFVENQFIGPNAHLTARDAAQPNLLDFFDFTNVPWSTPPTPPAPVTDQMLGHSTCTPSTM
jgi:phospholipase C